jgi:EAL domain-containing protein (putative c-di-GMP-specific phosphodiesterase class I)
MTTLTPLSFVSKFSGRTAPMHMGSAAVSLDVVLRDIRPEDITPQFQPILDLSNGTVLGYEILSRGPAPYESPAMLFSRARELGLTAELERACRAAALARVARLAPELRQSQWFVNISPEVFCEGAEHIAPVIAAIRSSGIEPQQVVLEITERAAIDDAVRFERAARRYTAAGFRIALDDFGSGVNGLLTLLLCKPDIIKLDMELTRGVHAHSYKRSIVRAIVSLADSVGAQLIAEGVETRFECTALANEGVRFAQGRFFAAPSAEPVMLH